MLQAHITNSRIACSWVPILQVGGLVKVGVNCFPKVHCNMAWSVIEPTTSRSRVQRANHFATLPLYALQFCFLAKPARNVGCNCGLKADGSAVGYSAGDPIRSGQAAERIGIPRLGLRDGADLNFSQHCILAKSW
ncbi:hypothetical protein ElyMa_000590400 [Elysia marginata]|uniref:Uncharacterized protein n=1 Tax=Elysia marginata TaxID=1093978 RepID=A0AAV4G809_9GAST|nr:hypothetical protein ElyMa_000590400 [Elysia marginata]